MFKYNSLEVPVEKRWVIDLYQKYRDFLIKYNKEQKPVLHHLRGASKVFLKMEDIFPADLSYEWIVLQYDEIGRNCSFKSLTGFLINNSLIKAPSNDEKYKKSIEKYISQTPINFQKCFRGFVNERLYLRERQIKNNASSPLNIRTIDSDACNILRMIRWMKANFSNVERYSDITEDMVNKYLLSLTESNRECVRKDIYVFFKYAYTKHFLFYIPMTDYKTRETKRVANPLDCYQQAELLNKIMIEGISYPAEALMTSFSLFHALTSTNQTKIKLNDIDVDRQIIMMQDIPSVYLMNYEMNLLKEYLQIRKDYPNCENNEYLYVRRRRGYYIENVPVGKEFITRQVKRFSGYTPTELRITCLQEMASANGAYFIREAYGISETHAGRYGSHEEYLIDEAINECLGEDNESIV